MPVLGLIFLRYADHEFAGGREGARGQGLRAAQDRQDGLPGPGRAVPAGGGPVLEPDRSCPKATNIGKAINDAMKAIEAENADLKDVLPEDLQPAGERDPASSCCKTSTRSRWTSRATSSARSTSTSSASSPWPRGRRAASSSPRPRIVKLIVEIIEPFHGRIFDPACGSGGMFVQSRPLRGASTRRTRHRAQRLRPGAGGRDGAAVPR